VPADPVSRGTRGQQTDTELGEAVLARAVSAYRAALGSRLIAGYALGSLAHGGFSALVSDVDLGLILHDPVTLKDRMIIRAVAGSVRAGGSALDQRLSVFWGTPATFPVHADNVAAGQSLDDGDGIPFRAAGQVGKLVDVRYPVCRALRRPQGLAARADLQRPGGEDHYQSGNGEQQRHDNLPVLPLHYADRRTQCKAQVSYPSPRHVSATQGQGSSRQHRLDIG
jgi:hypothetical protein